MILPYYENQKLPIADWEDLNKFYLKLLDKIYPDDDAEDDDAGQVPKWKRDRLLWATLLMSNIRLTEMQEYIDTLDDDVAAEWDDNAVWQHVRNQVIEDFRLGIEEVKRFPENLSPEQKEKLL